MRAGAELDDWLKEDWEEGGVAGMTGTCFCCAGEVFPPGEAVGTRLFTEPASSGLE